MNFITQVDTSLGIKNFYNPHIYALYLLSVSKSVPWTL